MTLTCTWSWSKISQWHVLFNAFLALEKAAASIDANLYIDLVESKSSGICFSMRSLRWKKLQPLLMPTCT